VFAAIEASGAPPMSVVRAILGESVSKFMVG